MASLRNGIAKAVSHLAEKIAVAETTPAAIMNTATDETGLFGNPVKGSGTKSNGSIPTPELTDLRKIKPVQRKEAVAACETLDAKLGIFHACFENIPRYALGRGITPTGNSADSEFSKRATEYFYRVTNKHTFDAREEHNFVGMQPMIMSSFLCAGDLGVGQVRDGNFNPRLQIFPSQAIDDPWANRYGWASRSEAKTGWKEGILRAGNGGRALKYRVLTEESAACFSSSTHQKHQDFDAANFMHIGRFNKIGQNRPLPWMLHGTNAAVNILDLRALNMQAAKINSYFAGWIESRDGSVPASISETVFERMEKQSLTADGAAPADDGSDQAEVMRSYANLFGAAGLPVFEDGEKLNFFKGDFSSMNIMELINWLIHDLAIGFGVDSAFIWAVQSQSGPMARLTLQKADWFFDSLVQIMVTRFCQRVWDGVIEDGIARNLLAPPEAKFNADFTDCAWQGPGSMTIDKGRDGKLFRDLVNSGMEARSLWHEMNGRNGGQARKANIAEIIDDIKECQDQAEKRGMADLWPVIARMYFGNDKAFDAAMNSLQGGITQTETDPEALADAIVDQMEFRSEMAA